MSTPAAPAYSAFSRRSAARVVGAVASTGGLLAGLGIVAATPAFAATAADCTDANTVTAPTDNAARIQTLLDDDAVSVICLDGTFVLSGSLIVDRDVTLFGLPGAVLDGAGQYRILDEEVTEVSITVQNLTLQNGYADGGDGGAIQADTVTVIDSTFRSNSASFFAGAIWADSGVTVTGSTFDGNTAGDGGAIAGYGTFTLIGSTFVDNEATFDGGAVFGYGVVSVTDSTFVGNTAGSDGGAVLADTSTVTNSTFVGNTAGYEGGAIFTGSSAVQFSTFLDNAIDAGLQPTGTVAELPGEAIYLAVSDGEVLSIRGNIFAGDGANAQLGVGEVAPEPSPGAIIDRGGNVFSTLAATESNFTSPDASTQFGKTPAQIFGSTRVLADNGGTTRTLALVAGSPAIDAVPPLVTPDSAPAAEYAPAAQADVVLDQRGNARSGLLDAGSFEFVPPAPQLAETGADSGVTGWLASLGALLLAAGVGVVATARRRANR